MQLSAQSGDSPQWLITILFLPVQFLDWKPTMLRFAKNCMSTREQFLMLISTEAIPGFASLLREPVLPPLGSNNICEVSSPPSHPIPKKFTK
jgi:hypothetical protein